MIQTIQIPFEEVPFSQRDKDYTLQSKVFEPFITNFPSKQTILAQAKLKQKHPVDRQLLVEVLTKQYSQLTISAESQANIESLKNDHTFTIVTAHQPALLTGPLYYIFKICSCINLCTSLNTDQAEYRFVPVFVSGGEDHDFEEIRSLVLFGKTVTWDTIQTGSVGRMTTDGLDTVLDEVGSILGDRSLAADLLEAFRRFLPECSTYNQFQQRLVHHLFDKYGLLYLSTDDVALKQALLPIFKRELTEEVSAQIVPTQQAKLNALGYPAQAYVRELNLFYIGEGMRERITKRGDIFEVLNTDITFGERDIDSLASSLSPNVVLRPLTQEYILPNVAYIGGGGEIAYWLERKTQFAAFGIPFPLLIRRNSAGIISSKDLDIWAGFGFGLTQIFSPLHTLTDQYLANNDAEFSLSKELEQIGEVYLAIAEKAKSIDKTLESAALAIGAKEGKAIEQFESRLRKVLKAQHDTQLSKIEKIQQQLMPSGGLQERHDNILTYFSKYGLGILDDLVNNLNPLETDFILMKIST